MTKRDGFWVLVLTPAAAMPIATWIAYLAAGPAMLEIAGAMTMILPPIYGFLFAITPLGRHLWKGGAA